MSVQSRIHHLSDMVDDGEKVTWRNDWPYLLVVCLSIMLTGLLFLGFVIRRWNDSNTPWDATDHWVGTRQFAITFAIADVLLVMAYVHFRPNQPAFMNVMLWYLVCSLLSPALALLLERVDPRRITAMRVRVPSEQPPPPPSPSTTILAEEPPAPPRQKKPTTPRRGFLHNPPKRCTRLHLGISFVHHREDGVMG